MNAWDQTAKIWGSTPNGVLGRALAVDGDTLVATGAGVHVYQRTSNGAWEHTQVLRPSANPFRDDGPWGSVNGQAFGSALAIDEGAGVLVVGAPGFDVTGNVTHHETDAGAVYIFEQAPNGTWELAARFIGPVDGDWNDWIDAGNSNGGPGLGSSVAVSGDTVVAGIPLAVVDGDPLRGQVDVYERQDNGTWTHTHRLTSPYPDGKMWDQFGSDVAIAGDRFAVGAPSEASGTGAIGGAVHVYEDTAEGWTPVQRVTAGLVYVGGEAIGLPGPVADAVATGGSFGEAVAFDEDASTLVVGSSWGNRLAGIALPTSTDLDLLGLDGVLTNPWGVVYVFDYTIDGFSYTASLENPDREAHSGFGRDVAINNAGNTVLVGAELGNQSDVDGVNVDRGVLSHHPSTGAAYVFEPTSDGWRCASHLSGDDTDSGAAFGDDFFGTTVAISDAAAWVGAPMNGPSNHGSLYRFQPVGPADDQILPTSPGVISPCGPDL